MAELRTIARPYAKAAFAAAIDGGALTQWESELATLAALARHPKVARMIGSPTMTAEARAQELAKLAGDLTPALKNFLQVLADNHRLPLLPPIAEQFAEYKAEREKRIAVEISSAFDVDAQTSERLSASLKQKLDRDVDVQVAIDKSLIGGVVIRAGDIVIDSSVKGRLAKLAETLQV
ncbi:MAG: F0F1 ATP synthase subunit delta [Gammaproteobacteria bacterium]|nr:F0F1 ATP synthase subunit delta [Gammaproteobacteria bacterium]NND37983.1 F0F1 ATP synthase subunit delta [Pseudomonadales bacterium]MBT8151215.1 F0F1 ATP synthase subunit delta [Gammaproteobacteria bacterium]NNL11573.1 F0F1 ATP synthase subunit delta [Pseudomonadales bacterium]NNM12646.1 F0F1 ATP synthase subunit delta [Pseudomonadales bacterium]